MRSALSSLSGVFFGVNATTVDLALVTDDPKETCLNPARDGRYRFAL